MDYGINLDHILIKCDNTSAINLNKNPIQHSRTKNIDIRHHFLRDHVQNGDISLEFVDTNNQHADIFTKPLNEETLNIIKHDLSRADIMFSICLCAHFQSSPRESHFNAIKRIFKYLSARLHLGHWYPRNSSFGLICYSDTNFVGSLIDRKSTSGTCQFLGQCLIS